MKSKTYSTIVISSILAFVLIATIPTTPVSAIVHEGLMGEDQGWNATQGENGNMTQGENGGNSGGMTEGQTGGETGTTEGQ